MKAYVPRKLELLWKQYRPWGYAILTVKLFILLIFLGVGTLNRFPYVGAQGADYLRKVFGDQFVANFENIVYQSQDGVTKWVYRSFGLQSASPWTTTTSSKVLPAPQMRTQSIPVIPSRDQSIPVVGVSGVTAKVKSDLPQTPKTNQPVPWSLTPLNQLGTLSGEGQWSPYIWDASGKIVAYRTFLQPDPMRTYAVPAIVAFDLENVRLHFVLGSIEPQSSIAVTRTGEIPLADKKPGYLLAAFNGGFKAQHGHFGVMVDGVTLLPPKPNLGTVAIYKDGRVRIGSWGTDLGSDPLMVMWRQNGPLIIHDGVKNPHTATPQDWSYTVSDITAVWRSGLGISADGRTLYYVAGSGLTVSALTDTLASAGAYQAMQLDINNYWVHFDEIKTDGNRLTAIPLIDSMKQDIGRFLSGYRRDYFFVTGK